MKNDISTRKGLCAKSLYLDVMSLSRVEREKFIERYTPNINRSFKEASLK